jgi:hypothetical protein
MSEPQYSKSKAYESTYQRGRTARRSGKHATACPYNSRATSVSSSGRRFPNGERAFARAWMAGWHFEDELMELEAKLDKLDEKWRREDEARTSR